MAKNPSDDRLTHPLLEKLGANAAAAESLFAYSVKIVCGRQTETTCCCVAGTRPGVYATEVNTQNLNLVTAPVLKFVLPLINSGAVVAREPNVADPLTLAGRHVEAIKLPPLGATMDDCCRIAELLLGAPPSGRHGAHHRHPDDRKPVRAVRLRGLHGEPAERGRHKHRCRVHSVATTGTSRPRVSHPAKPGASGFEPLKAGLEGRLHGPNSLTLKSRFETTLNMLRPSSTESRFRRFVAPLDLLFC